MQEPIRPSLPTNLVLCTQCGGELHPDEGQMFLTCPYCNSTVYLDKAQVVFHWYLAPTLDEPKARSALARWMSSSQTVKDLDRKARMVGHSFEYFPLWYFKRQVGGKDEILLEPAAATSITELRSVRLPAGDLRKYQSSLNSEAHEPTVPLQAAMAWLQQKGIAANQLAERALVHIPIHVYKYSFQGQTYTAIVEAATGTVLANLYPNKAETPYLAIGGVSAAIFLCLASFPVFGFMAGEAYLFTGLLACTGLGAFAALGLVAIAAWIANKV